MPIVTISSCDGGPWFSPKVQQLLAGLKWAVIVAISTNIWEFYNDYADYSMIDWKHVGGSLASAALAGAGAYVLKNRAELFALLSVPPDIQAELEDLRAYKAAQTAPVATPQAPQQTAATPTQPSGSPAAPPTFRHQ